MEIISNPENESNVMRGLELARKIVREHEAELRTVIDEEWVSSYTDELQGEFSSISLLAEFEEKAREEGIDLEEFYREAPRMSLHGHKFELLGLMQIIIKNHR